MFPMWYLDAIPPLNIGYSSLTLPEITMLVTLLFFLLRFCMYSNMPSYILAYTVCSFVSLGGASVLLRITVTFEDTISPTPQYKFLYFSTSWIHGNTLVELFGTTYHCDQPHLNQMVHIWIKLVSQYLP